MASLVTARRKPRALAAVAFAWLFVALSGCGGAADDTTRKDSAGPPELSEPSDVALPGVDAADAVDDAWRKPEVAPPPDVAPDLGRCPRKTPCDDGDLCTVQDECDEVGVCRGIPYTCTHDLACMRGVCRGDGECDFVLRSGHCLVDGACYREGQADPTNPCHACITPASSEAWTANDVGRCDDADPCTSGDACRGGICVGAPLACDDGNPCTDDSCDAATVTCLHAANAASCDDGNPCTSGDVCADSACTPGPDETDCDDGNACTLDRCEHPLGCIAEPLSGGACDDGSPCSVGDRCDEGTCSGAPISCNDANPCTDEVCDPDSERDADYPCDVVPNAAPCDDLDPCTVDDFCANGACRAGAPYECPDADGNVCTEEVCVPNVICYESGVCIPAGQCVRKNNRRPCDDGDPCHGGDRCANGVCVAGNDPPECNDGNLCTTDTCVEGIGCLYAPEDRDCSDGNPCTIGDHCLEGVCAPGPDTIECDDGNLCTDDTCDPLAGCRFVPNRAPCDDNNPCSVGDYCQFAQCLPGRTPLPCDDGDPCTTDSCLLLIGCHHAYNTAACEDGNPCTVGDLCDGSGGCVSGTEPLVCDDENECTDDACIDGEGCRFTPNLAVCDDGNPCTTTDACAEGICVGSGWLECDDLGPCTNEFCDPEVGCTATVVAAFECRPQCVITYPPRGATLIGPGRVEVQGYVESPAGAVFRASINQIPVSVDETNHFTFSMPTQHGMNVIVMDCEDEFRAQDHVVQAFHMATRYNPVDAANPTASMVSGALLAWLGHTVFDDNDGRRDDIAGIVEYLAGTMDLIGMLPNPVTSGNVFPCDYDVSIPRIDYASPKVDIWPQPGGLFVRLTIAWLTAPVEVDWCFGASGTVRVRDIYIDMDVNMAVGADGFAQATLGDVQVEVSEVDVTIDGVLGFLTNWLVNFFEKDIADMLVEAVRDQLGPQIETALESALNALALNQTIEVPAILPGMEPTSITLVSRLEQLDFTGVRALASMKTAVVAPKGTPYSPAGSLVWDNCMRGAPRELHLDEQWEIQLALHDDLLNQILYAAYWAGLMEFTLTLDDLGETTGELPIPGGLANVAITVSAMLPPVVTSCNAFEDVLLQLGDVGIHATFTMLGLDVELDMFASVELNADVDLVDTSEGNQLTISIKGVNFVEIEVASLNDALLGNEGVIGSLLQDVLLPMALGAIEGQTFGFLVPSIDVGALAPELGLPDELVIRLDVQRFYRELGYTILSGIVY